MNEPSSRKGVYQHYTEDELRRFAELTVTQKLEWLEAMRRFLLRFQPERQRNIMNRFRRGEL